MTSLLKLAFLTVVVAMVTVTTMSEAASVSSEQEAVLDLLEVCFALTC